MVEPRLEHLGPLRLAGISRQHNRVQEPGVISHVIGAQWRELRQRCGFPSSHHCVGVFGRMADGDTRFSYFCGAPPSVFAGNIPDGLSMLELPLMKCAVFPYLGHVSGMSDFVLYILRDGLREAGLSIVPDSFGTPEFCERYGAGFDPVTLTGGIEVFVPVL